MNLSNYPKPQILLRQDSICGITWRGYLTRITLLVVGFGGYILLSNNNKINIGENYCKRCFYALRKYFPRGKNDKEINDKDFRLFNEEMNSVPSLESSKSGVFFEITAAVDKETEEENLLVLNSEIAELSLILKNEMKNQTTIHEVCQSGDEGENQANHESRILNVFPDFSMWRYTENNKFRRNFMFFILIALALLTTKFEVFLDWLKFIGYKSIPDYLMPLVIIPTIYIWFTYRTETAWL